MGFKKAITYAQLRELRATLRTLYEWADDAGCGEELDRVSRALEDAILHGDLYLEDLHPGMDPPGEGPLQAIHPEVARRLAEDDMTLVSWFTGDPAPAMDDLLLDVQGYGRPRRKPCDD